MSRTVGVCAILVCSMTIGASAGPKDYRVVDLPESGALTGAVTFDGAVPQPVVLSVHKDQAVCGDSHPVEEFVVDPENAGLMNVVIKLRDITAGKAFEIPDPVISQSQCRYIPHVQVFKQNAKLTIRNTDDLLHNIHAIVSDQSLFNVMQPAYIKK